MSECKHVMGISKSEIQDVLDDLTNEEGLEPEEVDAMVDHVIHEFSWEQVFAQIVAIAEEWVPDRKSHMGLD